MLGLVANKSQHHQEKGQAHSRQFSPGGWHPQDAIHEQDDHAFYDILIRFKPQQPWHIYFLSSIILNYKRAWEKIDLLIFVE